jgi:nucleoside-diphosphate-sugar epimerase
MTILITGGAGYIGSKLLRDLPLDERFEGATIRVLDNMIEQKYCSLMNLPPQGRYEFILGDICNREDLKRALDGGVRYIIHLAALTNAVTSFERRETVEQVNYLGTKNLVELAAQQTDLERFVYFSTTSVYGRTKGIVTEEAPCHPASPYGLYKLYGEEVVREAMAKKGLNATIVRLATVYGYSVGIRFHTVLNIFVFRAAMGLPLEVYGDGTQKRPFIHVADVSQALQLILTTPETNRGTYNIVGQNASVLEILELTRQHFPSVSVRFIDKESLNQISYEVDSSRLRRLGFKPTKTLDHGIAELAQLFRGNP